MNNKTVILQFSDNSTLSINLETYLDLGLKEGVNINQEDIIKKDAYISCYKACLSLIKRKDYSKNKLDNLLSKKFEKSIVNSVLITIYNQNILDEKTQCFNLINSYINKDYGPLKIAYLLKEKGYDLSLFNSNEYEYHLDECAHKYLKKHQGKLDAKIKNNLYRYLVSKGYPNEMILSYFTREVNEDD